MRLANGERDRLKALVNGQDLAPGGTQADEHQPHEAEETAEVAPV